MSSTLASRCHSFHKRRTCGRTLLLFICLCATIAFVFYAYKVDSPRTFTYLLDQRSAPSQVPRQITPSLTSVQQAQSRGLFPLSAPVGSRSRNYDNTSSNLALTVASSTAAIMSDPWSEDEEALVDAGRKSMDDLASEAAAAIRNIPSPPYILGNDKNGPAYFRNSSCARFPTIHHLEFSNINWQTLRTSNGTFYLYGAYYDIRTLNPLGPTLRILGMMDKIDPNVTTYCQIWFQGEKEPTFSKVLKYEHIRNDMWRDNKQRDYQPYLLSCHHSDHNGKVPTSVSVVEKPCDAATNNLKVVFNKPAKKKSFAVCVKGLDFIHVDISVRLVEWIELLGILGADKIFIYNYAVHPNATKVLRYYQERGTVDVTPLTLPGSQPNDSRLLHVFLQQNLQQKRLNELIPYNDCLYRNLYENEYIAAIDIDEVIVPMKGGGWAELMLEVYRESRLTNANVSMSSYSFRYTRFMDEMMQENQWFQGIPKYLHMLQHVYRDPVRKKNKGAMKSFIDPEQVLLLYNHYPRACLNGSCTAYSVGADLAQLQHYRDNCFLATKKCTKEYRERMRKDTTIWHYKGELIHRARKVLKYLGFIPAFHSAATEGLAALKS